MKFKSIIAALILAASSAFAQVPSYVPTNGLVGWWPFNGNANDESGNGNNGSFTGPSCIGCGATTAAPTLTVDRNNISNSSYQFTNNLDFISIPNSTSLQLTNQFTISIWANPNLATYGTGNTYNSILQKWGGTGSGASFIVSLTTNGIPYLLTNNGSVNGQACIGTNPLALNSWSLITFTFDNGTGKLYVNGNLVTTTNNMVIPAITNNTVEIGRNLNQINFNSADAFVGKLDDIGIWNRALTQQEITNLYNAQSCIGNISADGPTTFCSGNYVNLTSDVVGGTYQWKKNGVNVTSNGTSRTYKATATGSYTCVATCNGTALTSNAIQVTTKTNAFASVSASGATSFCAGDSVTLNCTNLGSNYSVQWYRTNISMENATSYSQVVKQPGTYKVVTKNLTTGCSRISGSSVVVAVNCRLANPDVIAADITESDFDAVTREAEPKGKIYIYPNPTSDNKFTVELMALELNGDATLEVYNAMGQILSSEKVNITNGTLNRTIQIDEQSKGQLCLVRLIAGSEVYDSKVILK